MSKCGFSGTGGAASRGGRTWSALGRIRPRRPNESQHGATKARPGFRCARVEPRLVAKGRTASPEMAGQDGRGRRGIESGRDGERHSRPRRQARQSGLRRRAHEPLTPARRNPTATAPRSDRSSGCAARGSPRGAAGCAPTTPLPRAADTAPRPAGRRDSPRQGCAPPPGRAGRRRRTAARWPAQLSPGRSRHPAGRRRPSERYKRGTLATPRAAATAGTGIGGGHSRAGRRADRSSTQPKVTTAARTSASSMAIIQPMYSADAHGTS